MARLLLLASIAVTVLGCGGGDPPDHGSPTPSPRDPSDSPDTPADSTRAELVDMGIDPYANTVPDDDVRPEECAQSGERPDGACRVNSDCGICHDGSPCGRVATREEISRLGVACRQEDTAECESAAVRCCSGHCQLTGS